MPAQSTTLRPQPFDHSSGDKGHPGVPVPPRGPPTTSEPQTLGNRDVQNRAATREARDEDNNDREGEDVQSREATHKAGADFSIPKESPSITTELHSVDRGDRVVQGGKTPSMSIILGTATTSNEISPTPKLEVVAGAGAGVHFESAHFTGGGHAFGNDSVVNNIFMSDGQFTEIQRNLICDYIANLLPDINNNLKKHVLAQSISSLPRAKAMFNDYQNKKKSGPCFKGTREALLREMAEWATTSSESRMYILFGLAGIGKSTVAYTIASRANDLNLLGASFFFSRDEANRKNAQMFFTTVAYHLCVYNEMFAKAIGNALLTPSGSAAITKDPQDQLQALILEPLRPIIHSLPILIIVDALDECDDDDAFSVLAGLSQLIREFPSFKVILTTRPKQYLNRFSDSQGDHKTFHLENIENRVVDGDIRLFLNHGLSLEVVQKYYPRRQWCASDEEIDSLVRVAGGLFIIASTTVRYIFDKFASDPEAQMQKLLRAFAQHLTPFKDLDHFYTVILRNIVPENCDNDVTVKRYQSVVGAIIFVQSPLPVSTLAHLINIDAVKIHEVLDNLQSVILLDSNDVPHIYHKSLPDYLTDKARCKDPHIRIDTGTCHTQIVTRCFGIMEQRLKCNILGLGDPTRFMNNKDGIREEQLQEKIPQQLRYACVYWANHLEITNLEDTDLATRLKSFVDEHLLHWFEVLSLIGKLDLAHHAIGVVLKLQKSRSSDLHQLLSDALRFIGKFYELIKRSALHTYYSALPFTPSKSLLYRRYINKDAVHNLCSIEGGPEKWDSLVADKSHGQQVDIIKFSLNSNLFISCSQGRSKFWDAATGTPISTIPGHTFAVANDFSTVASSQDKTITFYNVNGSAKGTTFPTPSMIEKLAFSSESNRVAAALSDGTVMLWKSGNSELFKGFEGYEHQSQLQFSPTGARLAYSSGNNIKLQDGIGGKSIADLPCGSIHEFEFSGDGSRIAAVSPYGDLTLWNSENGRPIAAVRDVDSQYFLAISANGSLLATADYAQVRLWSETLNSLAVVEILELYVDMPRLMAFSLDDLLAIATRSDIKLYNVKTRTFIHTLPLGGRPRALAFSPDSTRLAVGVSDGKVNLWDIRGIDASSPPSKGNATAITALTLSRDCSRLACGFEDGAVELWGTTPTKRRINSLDLHSKMAAILFRIFYQSRRTESICALEVDPNSRLFASGSDVGTIKLWNGGDGALRGTLEAPSNVKAVALSNSVLVATWGRLYAGVTLWSLDTLGLVHTFKEEYGDKVSISEDSGFIAISRDRGVSLLDAVKHTTIATFDVPDNLNIHTMTFLPDNSQLVVQSDEGDFLSLDRVNKRIIRGATLRHLIRLPNTPLWHSVPIWHCQNEEQHYFAALFSQDKSPVPVLWVPGYIPVTAWTQGSSMVALGCKDGRVILVRLPTSQVS